MRRPFTALILTTMMTGTLFAQEARLSGTVTEVFGNQIVLATPDGRILVTLPAGVTAPAPGALLDLGGMRDGDRFTATDLTTRQTAASVTGTDESALPAPLRGLGLTEIRLRPDDDGETYLHARLPEGGWLRAEARGDRLLEVQTDAATLPAAVLTALLPAPARAEPRLAEITHLTEIDLEDDGEISVEGRAADGMRIEMEFSRDGTLRSFEREIDDRRSLTEEAARTRLSALGYSDIGFVERGGRHVTAIAANPYGDVVEVRLDDQGRVERERLWQNGGADQ